MKSRAPPRPAFVVCWGYGSKEKGVQWGALVSFSSKDAAYRDIMHGCRSGTVDCVWHRSAEESFTVWKKRKV